MGYASRANKNPKPRTKELSGPRQRDLLRTTVPGFTRAAMWKHLGFEVKELPKKSSENLKENSEK